MQLGGIPQIATPGPGADEYTTTFKEYSGGGNYAVYAVVTDDADVQTLSEPVYFRVTEPPVVELNYFDGEYSREVTDGAILSAASPIELLTNVRRSYDVGPTSITKVEFYADEKLICLDINHERNESTFYNYRGFKCAWRARPGKHTLSAIATDSDGVVGKSKLVSVLVQ